MKEDYFWLVSMTLFSWHSNLYIFPDCLRISVLFIAYIKKIDVCTQRSLFFGLFYSQRLIILMDFCVCKIVRLVLAPEYHTTYFIAKYKYAGLWATFTPSSLFNVWNFKATKLNVLTRWL